LVKIEVVAECHGRTVDLFVNLTIEESAILMGYININLEIAVNQDTRGAGVYTSFSNEIALMDRNQLNNVNMVSSERKREELEFLSVNNIESENSGLGGADIRQVKVRTLIWKLM
jgi:hypothetical protein